MKIIEELSMNAFPALQTLFYDGWILRFAEGYGNRANSVNPIYQSLENIDVKIDYCDMIFKKMNLNTTFKITPFVLPNNLDQLLINRNYEKIHLTSMQILKLDNLIEPDNKSVTVNMDFDETWYSYYCRFTNMNGKDEITYRKMLKNLLPESLYVLLLKKDEVVACGLAVIENGFVGIFDVVVNKNYRNNGNGRQLILNILKQSKERGAKNAYLQVMVDNCPAYNLYSKIGFKEIYKYYYRQLIN